MRQLGARSLRISFALMSLWLLLGFMRAASAEEISVRAAVENEEVFLGESFAFQIQVEGSDTPEEPNLTALQDFSVRSLGGRSRNSESINIINGQMSRVVRRGYVFSFRLVPKRTGKLTIPPIEVSVGGKKVRTRSIQIRVKEPAETEDFKLRLVLSKSKCYVGEPVKLSVTWYIGKDVRGFEFSLPVLEEKMFGFADPEMEIDHGKKYYRIPVGQGEEIIATKGQARLEGKDYATLSFYKVLIPKEAGTFQIPRATVACEVLTGHRKRRDFFSDDFFGAGQRGVYRRFVIPSNSLALQVAALPEAGRPPGFAGHVGKYSIEASASPTAVNIGDPITLTVTLSGPEYLKDVDLPPLKDQPALARDFKIPQEISPGKVEGKRKIFTQTIRATHADVKEIPSIELAYFDTESGKYGVASSDPIPLAVRATKVITAQDAEGRESVSVKRELQAWHEGLAHNYEDVSVLEDQEHGLATSVRSPVWMSVIGLPPLTYFVLLVSTTLVRRRQADPAARKAKKAYSELARSLKTLRRSSGETSQVCGAVLEAARNYLGSKLRISPQAITYRDVERYLKDRSIKPETLDALKHLFEECEAGRYTGGAASFEGQSLIVQRALDVARDLERDLK